VLTHLDDYPIHQTPEPIAHPATGDRNFYDRYFFQGYTREGDLFFAMALGLYPNRRVMDAAFSVVRGGRQSTVRGSRLAPLERTETRVGPISVEVIEPLRRLRVRVDENAHGVSADLVFDARTQAIEEPRFTQRVDGRLTMDSTRLTQFGAWTGTLTCDGERIAVDPVRVLGARDRSWGVRPVGEREAAGPPAPLPQYFWLWAPLHFDDVCTHFDVNEDAAGRPWHAFGAVVPAAAPGAKELPAAALETMSSVGHRVRWQSGTRRAESAALELRPLRAGPLAIDLEPILTFQMLGIGYLHPTWGHGVWKGENVVDGERWTLAELSPMAPQHLHVQALCRATLTGDGRTREGVGVLEQLVIGPHGPSGFREILDPAR
jgi:hypothetical protein